MRVRLVLVLSPFLLAACAPAIRSATGAGAPAPVASRPLPHAVQPPAAFLRAVERGSRTTTGEPGARYWQNWARYQVQAKLLTEEKRLEGTAQIVYYNRSPDSLPVVELELSQNLHAPGVVRNEANEVNGGVELRRVAVGEHVVAASASATPRYAVNGTRMTIHLATPLRAGDSLALSIDYRFAIAQAGASGRMGWDGPDLFHLAYWYPQVAVYDDVTGWHTDPFLGAAEFYHGFATYDVTVDVPAGWIVNATGRLENADEVLSDSVRARLARADGSDSVVRILTAQDFGRVTRTASGRLQWRFRADSVRDFAFSVTRRSLWDAARTSVGDRDGDGRADYTRVSALYRETAPRWEQAVRYGRHAITTLSRDLALPYPWPHMTAVEAQQIITGGMEYPMMTLIGSYTTRGDAALYSVIAHEFAHMWFPLLVSTDERRYGWMDEGWTSFNENQAKRDYAPGPDYDGEDRDAYLRLARRDGEGEMLRWSDFHYTSAAFGVASYQKPATVTAALRALIGEEAFIRGYRSFLRRWAYRHPTPWDYFNAMETAAGRDLDWFWGSWYPETWTLDHAVASVTGGAAGAEARVVIEDRGKAVMPARVTITRADGTTLLREVSEETWLGGATRATIVVPAGAAVQRVEIDPGGAFPDIDRSNNMWPSP